MGAVNKPAAKTAKRVGIFTVNYAILGGGRLLRIREQFLQPGHMKGFRPSIFSRSASVESLSFFMHVFV